MAAKKTVRAKFKVVAVDEQEINKYEGSEVVGKEPIYSIQMTPVTSGSKENDEFFKYTPGGTLNLSTINATAAKMFEYGKEYYIDISPAE